MLRNRKLAVLLFIHGDNLFWGSGNYVDASLISFTTNIIVITINYRLGVFGEGYARPSFPLFPFPPSPPLGNTFAYFTPVSHILLARARAQRCEKLSGSDAFRASHALPPTANRTLIPRTLERRVEIPCVSPT